MNFKKGVFMKLLVFIAYIFFMPYMAQASWTKSEQLLIQNIQDDEKLNLEGNPEQNQSVYMREALGLATSKAKNLKDFAIHPFSHKRKFLIPLKKTYFDNGIYKQESCAPFAYYNSLPVRGKWQKKKTDLIVIIPGLFTESSGINPTRLFNLLYQRGYHVFILPNPFSKEYIERYPRYSPGSFKKESEILLEAVDYLVNSNTGKVNKVHLIGMSYGAFISAVALALDKEKKISGKTLLLSPQIKTSTTLIQLLDPLIAESIISVKFNKKKIGLVKDAFRKGVGIKIYNGTLYTNINLFRKYQYHRKHAFRCATYSDAAIVSFERALSKYGMHDVDFKSNALKTKKEPWIFPWKVNPHHIGLQIWARDLRIWSTFQDYTYDTHIYYIDKFLLNLSEISNANLDSDWLLDGVSSRGGNFEQNPDELAYWLNIAYKKGNDNFSIFTTEDDFTNFPAHWNNQNLFPKFLRVKKHFQKWKKGSHVGYFSKAWFEKVLYTAFPKK